MNSALAELAKKQSQELQEMLKRHAEEKTRLINSFQEQHIPSPVTNVAPSFSSYLAAGNPVTTVPQPATDLPQPVKTVSQPATDLPQPVKTVPQPTTDVPQTVTDEPTLWRPPRNEDRSNLYRDLWELRNLEPKPVDVERKVLVAKNEMRGKKAEYELINVMLGKTKLCHIRGKQKYAYAKTGSIDDNRCLVGTVKGIYCHLYKTGYSKHQISIEYVNKKNTWTSTGRSEDFVYVPHNVDIRQLRKSIKAHKFANRGNLMGFVIGEIKQLAKV